MRLPIHSVQVQLRPLSQVRGIDVREGLCPGGQERAEHFDAILLHHCHAVAVAAEHSDSFHERPAIEPRVDLPSPGLVEPTDRTSAEYPGAVSPVQKQRSEAEV